MTVELQLETGAVEEIENSAALIFIDETGVEDMSDPNAPFFGIAGCFLGAQLYKEIIDDPWSIVESSFPNQLKPLHASKLKVFDFSEQQMETVANFFYTGQFGRLAAIATIATENTTSSTLFECVAISFQQRIRDLLNKCSILPSSIV